VAGKMKKIFWSNMLKIWLECFVNLDKLITSWWWTVLISRDQHQLKLQDKDHLHVPQVLNSKSLQMYRIYHPRQRAKNLSCYLKRNNN